MDLIFIFSQKFPYKFRINRIMALSAFYACFRFRTLLPLLSPILFAVLALISSRHVFQICCMLQRNMQQQTAASHSGKQNAKIKAFVKVCVCVYLCKWRYVFCKRWQSSKSNVFITVKRYANIFFFATAQMFLISKAKK